MNEEKKKVEADLVQICSKLHIPKAAELKREPVNRDLRKIVVWRRFRSDMPCWEIGDHFVDYFSSLNWDKSRMESYESGGGMVTYTYLFRDGEYVVNVECEKTNNVDKSVVIACSWGLIP